MKQIFNNDLSKKINLKLLLVAQYFYPESFKINEVITQLNKLDFDIEILSGAPNYPGGKIFEGYKNRYVTDSFNGMKVYRVPLYPRGRSSSIRLILNYLSFVITATLRIFTLPRYDVILVYAPSPVTTVLPAIFLKLIKKTKVFFWIQDLWPESIEANTNINSKGFYNGIKFLVNFIYKNCNAILISCQGFRQKVMDYGIPDSKIIYLPNFGEDIQSVDINKVKDYLLPESFKIIYGGNIGNSQDFESIVFAAKKLKSYTDIKWIVIGNGRRFDWLKEQIVINDLESNIILLGQKPTEDMPYYYLQAEILIVNLKNKPVFHLTVPAKLQSYLAIGKPIIAGLDGDGKQIVNEAKCGFAYPPENGDELVDSVLKIYNMSKEERISLGVNAKKYFYENFHINMIIDKLNNTLKSNL